MKQCSRCKKTTNNFAKNKAKKDGLQSQCRLCVKETNAEYYKRSPEQNVNRLAYKEKSKLECRTYVLDFLKAHGCVDCGECDTLVLEFDHVRGEKLHNIAQFMGGGRSVETLKSEINKCEVRCANCHRKVTAKRGNWWRTLA